MISAGRGSNPKFEIRNSKSSHSDWDKLALFAEVFMGTYQGGSAPAMANQVCDGFTLLSQVSLKRLDLDQMKKLEFELEKRLRDTRGQTVDLNDQPALQARNRRISRIEGAVRMLKHTMQLRRQGRI
jgi:hypothetical protein